MEVKKTITNDAQLNKATNVIHVIKYPRKIHNKTSVLIELSKRNKISLKCH